LKPAILLISAALMFQAGCFLPGEESSAPAVSDPDPSPSGEEVYVDVTAAAGIDFVHNHGGFGERFMAETVGSGAGWFDYDNDGDIDAYLVQSGPYPGFTADRPYRNILYRNNGDGTFTDVTGDAGAGDKLYGMGCTFGDYDNDGLVDIYVTNFGPNRLYRNIGDGTFADVTDAAGVGDPRWGTGSGFADYDGDGDLDLYVANYVEHTTENNIRCGPAEFTQYCGPRAYPGTPDVLYRNNGDGSFTDVTVDAGMEQPVQYNSGTGLGMLWSDFDSDGALDVYVANDDAANFMYRNNGDGTFEDRSIVAGTAYNEEGKPEAGMGVDVADYDHDGFMDLFLTHFTFETNTLYRNTGFGSFEDRTYSAGLGTPSVLKLAFGTNFIDFDNDGWIDIYIVNGHLLDNVHLTNPTVTYEQEDQLFRNLGNGKFEDRTMVSGAYFLTKGVGRGAAFGDYDNDGDIDVLINQSHRPAVLLRNDIGNRGHFIQLDLRGRERNRFAIGARVTVESGDLVQVEEVRTESGYLSQNDLRLHFGLGDRDRVDRIEIRWPSGFVQTISGDAIVVDGITRIDEPAESPTLATWRK
jgi:hypothetical protein